MSSLGDECISRGNPQQEAVVNARLVVNFVLLMPQDNIDVERYCRSEKLVGEALCEKI